MTTYNYVYTNIVREVVSRIETAMSGTGKLNECKNFYLGDIDSANEQVDQPVIFMTIDNILESYQAQKKENKSGKLRLIFILSYGLYDARAIEQKSIFYDDSASKYLGFLPFIEAFLDVIHSDTSGNVDPRSNNLQRRSIETNVGRILKGKQHLETEITVTFTTKDFTMNARSYV